MDRNVFPMHYVAALQDEGVGLRGFEEDGEKGVQGLMFEV